MFFAALLLGAIYKFVYKSSGKKSGNTSKKGLFGQKRNGYGKESAALHNKFGTKQSPNMHKRFLGSDSDGDSDQDDGGGYGGNDNMSREEKSSVNKLMER